MRFLILVGFLVSMVICQNNDLCYRELYLRNQVSGTNSCSSDQDQIGPICYPKCKDGYDAIGPVCYEKCQAGFQDNKVSCFTPVDIYRKPFTEKTCKEGYTNLAFFCVKQVKNIIKQSYTRDAVVVCPEGKEQVGPLCFDKCKDGYDGVGPFCSKKCSSSDLSFNCGVLCTKSSDICSLNSGIFNAAGIDLNNLLQNRNSTFQAIVNNLNVQMCQ